MKRENFNSRIGFILVSAGCAIGIGNVWKFPYLAGQNGGGYFVLFYLLFLVIMGIPVMTMELAVGRASRKSAVLGYKALEPAGSKWHWHGWACVIGCLLLMMYYTTVSGWMLAYFFKFVSGAFTTVTVETSDSVFANMLGNPVEMGIFMAITVAGGLLVCSGGVQKGLEKVTKIMMVCLLALIVVLAVHSLTLSGAAKGIDFYLRPNMDTIRSVGIVGAVLFLASIPCVLGYNVWSGFHPMPGKDILDFEDFLVSSLLLPIGSLVYLLFCVSKRGWGFDKYLAECNKGTGIKMSPKFKVYFRYILPILIIIILVVGLVPLFR